MLKTAKKVLTIQERLNVIKEVDEGAKLKDLSKKYLTHRTTLSRILKEKDKYVNFAKNAFVPSKKIKRIVKVAVPETETALYNWFLNQRINKLPVTDYLLQIKAIEFHRRLNPNIKFEASLGWIQKFKKRHSIRLLKICGEKLSCNESAVPGFITKFQEEIKALGLVSEQIYNADETGLFVKNLNDKTLVAINEKKAPGTKNSKERITVMPCVNATGTHKLPLMIIGKANNPRCFYKQSLPDMHYRSSRNAWQNAALFKEWFFCIFVPEVTKYLKSKNLPVKAMLLLDNATCHLSKVELTTEDGRISVYFFPPNTTAILQPLDQHIINSIKQKYRKKLLLKLLSLPGNDVHAKLKQVNLKDTVFMITESWNEVDSQIIVNGFKHLLLSSDDFIINLPQNNLNVDDESRIVDISTNDFPITDLYRKTLPNTTLNDNEIMNWAAGIGENNRSNIDDDEILEDNNITQMDEVDTAENIDAVINSINMTIDWAERNLSIGEILFLRKIRETAVIKKINM